MQSIVDTATRRAVYCASQLYFSANMVALDAAGVEARIVTTVTVASDRGMPTRIASFIMPSTAKGSAM